MPKYLVRVTESINHDYLIEADNEDDALNIYYSYDDDQLKSLDIDGDVSWDRPWDVELFQDSFSEQS